MRIFLTAPRSLTLTGHAGGTASKSPHSFFSATVSRHTGSGTKVRKIQKHTRGSKIAGICSEERSMITPEYAHNFICDFILGKTTANTQLDLFS